MHAFITEIKNALVSSRIFWGDGYGKVHRLKQDGGAFDSTACCNSAALLDFNNGRCPPGQWCITELIGCSLGRFSNQGHGRRTRSVWRDFFHNLYFRLHSLRKLGVVRRNTFFRMRHCGRFLCCGDSPDRASRIRIGGPREAHFGSIKVWISSVHLILADWWQRHGYVRYERQTHFRLKPCRFFCRGESSLIFLLPIISRSASSHATVSALSHRLAIVTIAGEAFLLHCEDKLGNKCQQKK